MPFTLIKGSFHVVGYSPDGDSVKFAADTAAQWDKITGRPKLNKKGHAQLRLEGIDALETHYRPNVAGAKFLHQPVESGQAAREFLLARLGIKNVVWSPKGTEVSSADDGTPGYILTRGIDNSKYGRPVAFAFAGKAPKADGSEVTLTPAMLRKSVNHKLLAAGMAYPTYYQTLFHDLRDEFTRAVLSARNAKPRKGLWAADKSGGFDLTSLSAITDKHPILPKLFRRLTEHLAQGGTPANFRAFLASKKDGLLILPQAHHTDAMDFIVSVKGKRIGLTVQPENIVFDPQG